MKRESPEPPPGAPQSPRHAQTHHDAVSKFSTVYYQDDRLDCQLGEEVITLDLGGLVEKSS
jgi:hypothetical protein